MRHFKMWTALLAIQVNKAPYLFSSDLLSFIVNGPNKTNPQWVNVGSLKILSFGISDIFCSPNLPLSLRHTTHLCIKLLMTELALTIRKPHCLNSFNVRTSSSMGHIFSFYDTILWLRLICSYSLVAVQDEQYLYPIRPFRFFRPLSMNYHYQYMDITHKSCWFLICFLSSWALQSLYRMLDFVPI